MKNSDTFIHMATFCEKGVCDFTGWIEFIDCGGRVTGGTQVCKKCGSMAMSQSLRDDVLDEGGA